MRAKVGIHILATHRRCLLMSSSSMTTLMSKHLYSKLMNLMKILTNTTTLTPPSLPGQWTSQTFGTTIHPLHLRIILDLRTPEVKPHRISKSWGARQMSGHRLGSFPVLTLQIRCLLPRIPRLHFAPEHHQRGGAPCSGV